MSLSVCENMYFLHPIYACVFGDILYRCPKNPSICACIRIRFFHRWTVAGSNLLDKLCLSLWSLHTSSIVHLLFWPRSDLLPRMEKAIPVGFLLLPICRPRHLLLNSFLLIIPFFCRIGLLLAFSFSLCSTSCLGMTIMSVASHAYISTFSFKSIINPFFNSRGKPTLIHTPWSAYLLLIMIYSNLLFACGVFNSFSLASLSTIEVDSTGDLL